jgi:hypothetical protein
VFIANVPTPSSEDADAVAAAPLANGAFAVVWSDDQTNAVHGAIVSSAGHVASESKLTSDGVLAAWPSAALAATTGNTVMLFVADVPQPSTETWRVRMLMLDADHQLRPRASVRTIPIKYVPSGLQADELPGGAVVLQTGTTAQVFSPDGQLLSTHPQTTVIFGPAGGRIVPLSRLSSPIETYYSSLPTAAATSHGKVRLLVEKTDQPGFGAGSVFEDEVTSPGLPAGGWLAALNLNPAALVNSPDGLALVGLRNTGNAKSGEGRDSEVVLIPIPNS